MSRLTANFGVLSNICMIVSALTWLFDHTSAFYLLGDSAICALWAIGARD